MLDISKVGYKFFQTIEHTGQNKIKVTVAAQKLSSLEITVVDNQGSPVSGALVFISSTSKKNFLKFNNYTNDTVKLPFSHNKTNYELLSRVNSSPTRWLKENTS